MLTFHGRGHTVDVEAAVQHDGSILGMRVHIVADLGAYFLLSTAWCPFWPAIASPGRIKHRRCAWRSWASSPTSRPPGRIEVPEGLRQRFVWNARSI